MFLFALIPTLAHTLIGFFFVFFGFWNIYHWRPTMEVMIQKNIPHPWLFLAIGIAWQTVLGFMIILNFYVALAALLLIPFVIISTFIIHDFWKKSGAEKKLSLTLFISNLTVCIGALLLLITHIAPMTQIVEIVS